MVDEYHHLHVTKTDLTDVSPRASLIRTGMSHCYVLLLLSDSVSYLLQHTPVVGIIHHPLTEEWVYHHVLRKVHQVLHPLIASSTVIDHMCGKSLALILRVVDWISTASASDPW